MAALCRLLNSSHDFCNHCVAKDFTTGPRFYMTLIDQIKLVVYLYFERPLRWIFIIYYTTFHFLPKSQFYNAFNQEIDGN